MTLNAKPIDVFISYKREERSKAEAIAKSLVKEGYSVWWDANLLPGDRFHTAILEVIKSTKTAIVLWSKMAVESDFIRDEAGRAKDRGILIPVRLEDCEIPLGFKALHTLNLSNWGGDPQDQFLRPLVEAIRRKAEPSGDALEKEPAFAESAATEEAVHWREAVTKPKPSANDFQAYLSRFGSAALFGEIAQLQINALKREEEKAKKGPGLQGRILIAGSLVTLIGGIVTIVLNITTILEKLGLREPVVESKPFNETSVCTGDWFFRERTFCTDKNKPLYAVVTDGELCGYDQTSKMVQPAGFKECRHIEHGVERYANSDVVQGNSGWMGGGHTQPEWCQNMKNRYQAARPNIQINWSDEASSENSRKDWGNAEYNYGCRVTANWNPIYKLAATEACGRLDPVSKTERTPKRCEDKRSVTGYEEAQNATCALDGKWTLAEGARTKGLFVRYDARLADLPLCSTCDEYAANVEQRGQCLLHRHDKMMSFDFASADDPMRLAVQMKSAAKLGPVDKGDSQIS